MTNKIRAEKLASKQLFISCIVPMFNEEGHIERFIKALRTELVKLTDRYEIVLVDDGSSDNTVLNIEKLKDRAGIKLISFSRNFGKEQALTAGLEHCNGEVAVLIDADFQHPLKTIPKMLKFWQQGADMVYGVRANRDDESYIKRGFAKLFYWLMQKIAKINIPIDAGDFRLLDRRVIDALNSMRENCRCMKGMYAWVGFNTKAVPFKVEKRASGESRLHFGRLTELALTGITSFSDVPLRIWSLIGCIISLISFIYAMCIIIDTLWFGVDVPGYATIVVAVMFFGGIQLLSIGVLGEYIARIFNEVKQRPKYIIAKREDF